MFKGKHRTRTVISTDTFVQNRRRMERSPAMRHRRSSPQSALCNQAATEFRGDVLFPFN